jgi:hypothetical protein
VIRLNSDAVESDNTTVFSKHSCKPCDDNCVGISLSVSV